MQLFDMTQPCRQNCQEKGRFQVCYIKVGNLGVMRKIRLERDHQTSTFVVVQLVDAMQPGGAKVNINLVFWINGPPI